MRRFQVFTLALFAAAPVFAGTLTYDVRVIPGQLSPGYTSLVGLNNAGQAAFIASAVNGGPVTAAYYWDGTTLHNDFATFTQIFSLSNADGSGQPYLSVFAGSTGHTYTIWHNGSLTTVHSDYTNNQGDWTDCGVPWEVCNINGNDIYDAPAGVTLSHLQDTGWTLSDEAGCYFLNIYTYTCHAVPPNWAPSHGQLMAGSWTGQTATDNANVYLYSIDTSTEIYLQHAQLIALSSSGDALLNDIAGGGYGVYLNGVFYHIGDASSSNWNVPAGYHSFTPYDVNSSGEILGLTFTDSNGWFAATATPNLGTPEPSSAAFLLCGILGFGARRFLLKTPRRRKLFGSFRRLGVFA